MRHLFTPAPELGEAFLAAQREYADHDGAPDADGLTLHDLTEGLSHYIDGMTHGTFPRPGTRIGVAGMELWWCETPARDSNHPAHDHTHDAGDTTGAPAREFVGRVTLRHYLVPDAYTRGGHLWWSIRPSRRGQGLGTELLGAALPHAASHGIPEATLICRSTQHAARKAIETNGGRLETTRDGHCWYRLTTTQGHLTP